MTNEQIKADFIYNVKRGNLEIVKYLLERGSVSKDMQDNDRWTALHWAAWKGRLEIVQFLLQKDVMLDNKNKDGETALHLAVRGGHPKVVKCLLKAGIPVDVLDKYGKTPLNLAIFHGNLGIVKLLLNEGGASVNEKSMVNGQDNITALEMAEYIKIEQSLSLKAIKSIIKAMKCRNN